MDKCLLLSGLVQLEGIQLDWLYCAPSSLEVFLWAWKHIDTVHYSALCIILCGTVFVPEN